MSNIKFKIAAKTDVGRVRTNNEDNLLAACDLTTAPMKWVNDEECTLGDRGALLVVADGMGGMNAGEVASEIAIETVREFFAPENISADVLDSRVGIETFMKKAIVEADKRIKKSAKDNSEHKGMGTTIVIAWLLNEKLYVAWCGDSRAYIYNKKNGLRQITKDHSYVQELVDKGKLSPEDAFDYPDSNIITRCLCDGGAKARPDTLSTPISVCDNDIILLCTDGLSGMIRDHEIETVLAENEDNMSTCCDELIKAACEAAGHDNITVDLCKIVSGGAEPARGIRKNKLSNTISFSNSSRWSISRKNILSILFLLFAMALAFGGGYYTGKHSVTMDKDAATSDSLKTDTIPEKVVEKKGEIQEKKNDHDSIVAKVLDEKIRKGGDSFVYTLKDSAEFDVLIMHARENYNIQLDGIFLLKDGVITENGKSYKANANDKLLLVKKY